MLELNLNCATNCNQDHCLCCRSLSDNFRSRFLSIREAVKCEGRCAKHCWTVRSMEVPSSHSEWVCAWDIQVCDIEIFGLLSFACQLLTPETTWLGSGDGELYRYCDDSFHFLLTAMWVLAVKAEYLTIWPKLGKWCSDVPPSRWAQPSWGFKVAVEDVKRVSITQRS